MKSSVAPYTAARLILLLYQFISADLSPALCQISSHSSCIHPIESQAFAGCVRIAMASPHLSQRRNSSFILSLSSTNFLMKLLDLFLHYVVQLLVAALDMMPM